ncbi:MAG: hypothetical protein DRJ10_11560, partial [Bacteroidetes bacterium]
QLKSIEEHIKFGLNIHSFRKDFYQDFVDYFVFERGQQNSTIKDNAVKKINTFLNWLVSSGHIERNEFKGIKFPYKINPADTVSLTEQELNTIYNLDLSQNDKLKQVRDVFCLECYTGLRYSDAKKVSKSNISGDSLKIFTKKTTDHLEIPLRDESLKLLNSYFEKNLSLPEISTQKMNDYLKELGELCEFNDTINILKISGNSKTELVKHKYELLTTHTGRRTFVTLSYQKGIPDFLLMRITGHKSIETFRKYYRIKDIDAKKTFLEAWATIQPKYNTSEIIKNLIIKKVSLKTIAFSLGIDIEEIRKVIS